MINLFEDINAARLAMIQASAAGDTHKAAMARIRLATLRTAMRCRLARQSAESASLAAGYRGDAARLAHNLELRAV